jgi:hypothetical protein
VRAGRLSAGAATAFRFGSGEQPIPNVKFLRRDARRTAKACALVRDILRAMEQAVTAAPSFAGLLASLAAPASSAAVREPDWSGDGMADDIAVLSDEGALQSHARMGQSTSGEAEAGNGSIDPDSGTTRKPPSPERNQHWKNSQAPPIVQPLSIVEVDGPTSETAARDFKRASITIRLSKTECAQLRARAAESGMTISAYLRSCTFEVESLRAQVKDALMELRSASMAEKPGIPVARRSILQRMTHIWPRSRAEGEPQSA